MQTTMPPRARARAQSPAWHAFFRQAFATWLMFWITAAPVGLMLRLSVPRLFALTACTFLIIEGVDALWRRRPAL